MPKRRITRKTTSGTATSLHTEESGVNTRRFVHPSMRLTEEHRKILRESGVIPIESEKGETTRLTNVRLDSETLKQLRILKLRFKQQGKKLKDSEVLRLVLLEGLKHSDEIRG